MAQTLARRSGSTVVPAVVAALVVVAVLAAVLAATRLLRLQESWVLVPVEQAEPAGMLLAEPPPSAPRTMVMNTQLVLQVDAVPPQLRVFVAAGRALGPLAVAVGAAALASLLWGAAARGPFSARAPALLGVLAGAVAVAGIAAPLLDRAAATAVLDRLDLTGTAFGQPAAAPNPWWLLVSLGIAALVPVFAQGRRLAAVNEPPA